jgi:hypothetical protein
MQRNPLLIVGLVLVLMSVVSAGELKVCLDGSESNTGSITVAPPPPAAPGNDEATYTGTVRVFLVEPMARWTDADGNFYRYGFLDFPIVSNVNLLDGGSVYLTSTWNASTTSIGTIDQSNIQAIGVVFNSTTVLTDASPPDGLYFQARYADAAASATPGVVGHSQVNPPFTHPVFIEESTATW